MAKLNAGIPSMSAPAQAFEQEVNECLERGLLASGVGHLIAAIGAHIEVMEARGVSQIEIAVQEALVGSALAELGKEYAELAAVRLADNVGQGHPDYAELRALGGDGGDSN